MVHWQGQSEYVLGKSNRTNTNPIYLFLIFEEILLIFWITKIMILSGKNRIISRLGHSMEYPDA